VEWLANHPLMDETHDMGHLRSAVLAYLGVNRKKIGKLGETCPRKLDRVYIYSDKF
jgi:hypothetical protein